MYKAPRGTADILPAEQRHWHYVEERAVALARRHGYQRIDTPVFEVAGLFVRTVGQETDIVQKEMYTFEDRGGEEMTLRPEGTAPVCRAYLEHGMHNLPQPVRLYYFCPVFRYERPQSGRYRQHHQFGVEALGDADPAVDAEVIGMAWGLMQDLGLRDLSLLVNSIGDSACRPAYLDRLREYYAPRLEALCPDCRARHQRNPLRLLDCKRESCQPYALEAPRSADHLCPECQEHWQSLLGHLEILGIPYRQDHRLVRGLDYYTRTVFEVHPQEEGGQSTICGGGRYDGLIQELGGPPTPGIGFATGMERMVLNLQRQGVAVPAEAPRPIAIAHMGPAGQREAIRLARRLRSAGLTVVVTPAARSLKAQMRHASAMGAAVTLILGEEEIRKAEVTLRDMDAGRQESVPVEGLEARLAECTPRPQ
ncbi:MAG: histidine--tRNA ligase [Chloroflexi bacterium]|nr:histidine--tRNA ligase [Chloroflexota bacterium]